MKNVFPAHTRLAVAALVCTYATTATAQTGTLERGSITSPALAGGLFNDSTTRPYVAYLPPSYFQGDRRYPVYYLLHGWTGDVDSHVTDFQPLLDEGMQNRQFGECIVVFVDGSNALLGSFYRSSSAIGDYETYIVRDLVSAIDAKYRTLPVRESRGITGFSMGGQGAIHLALNFPEVFSVAVSQAGYYDATDTVTDNVLREVARVNPKTAGAIGSMTLRAQALFPYLPATIPDPSRPPFYYDPPYSYAAGKYTTNQAALDKLRATDVAHGDVSRHAQQAVRLTALKVVHGTADPLSPISQARSLHQQLLSAGVTHDYVEHPGEHWFLPAQAFPYLAQWLVGAEKYITPPTLTVSTTAPVRTLSFPTQVDVSYRVETTQQLGSQPASWTELTTVKGTGQPAKVPAPDGGGTWFFRVSASNGTNP